MQINNLFPIPVAIFNIDRELTNEEITIIAHQEVRNNEGNFTSMDHNVLEHKGLIKLKQFCTQCLNEYLDTIYKPKFKVKLRITQSWLNYTQPKQFHHRHNHSNSLITGVFYIHTDPDKDSIDFFNQNYNSIVIENRESNYYNSSSWRIPTIPGNLLIFPSNLTHMVRPTESAITRISLSFNSFPVGQLGDDNNLTGLYIKEQGFN